MKNQIYLLTLFALTSFSAFAQINSAGTLEATIYMNDTETAPFATVMLYDTTGVNLEKADATDDAGKLLMQGIPSGEYDMHVTYVGFDDYKYGRVTIEKGGVTKLGNITLAASAEALDEVTVTAKRPMIEIKPDKTIFNVAGSINAQGGNALELLRKAPGVLLDNNNNVLLLGKTGTIIYIDGKPSPLAPEDLANYLQGLPASAIDNIEVITNPSSKYEAEGNAGIINIRLKKADNIGTNASLTAGFSKAKNHAQDAGLQLNHRTNKVNVFGGYNYAKSDQLEDLYFERVIGPIRFKQDAEILNKREAHNIKLGADIFLSKKSTLGVLVNGNQNDGENLNSSLSDIFLDASTSTIDSNLVARNDINNDRSSYSVNLNYATTLKDDLTMNIDVDYGQFNSTNNSYQPNKYLDGSTQTLVREANFASDADAVIDIYTAKADFGMPFLSGNLGFGGKYANTNTDNDFQFFSIDASGDRLIDLSRTNRFEYEEEVIAGYINYSRSINKFNIQAGLRLENTQSDGKLTSPSETVIQRNTRSYLDYFPSGGITYKANEKNTYRLSYSRRLNRPNYQDLNPFEFKLDELTLLQGNPFLNPEYTNNIQLMYTYNYRLNMTLSYSRTKDMITRLTDTENLKQAYMTYENLAKQDAFSLTISYPFSPTPWWSMYWNVSGNHLANRSEAGTGRFTEDRSVDLDVTFASVFMQQTFKLPLDISAELSGFYNSPGIWGGNFETETIWALNFGVQRKFMDNKLTVRLGVDDIFYTQPWRANNNFGPMQITATGANETRRAKINLSYNFGNQKVRSRKRQTGIEDERRRTGNR